MTHSAEFAKLVERKPTKAQRRILKAMHLGVTIRFFPRGMKGAAICVPGKPDHHIRLDTFRSLLSGGWVEETVTNIFARSDAGLAAIERNRK